MEKMMAYSSQHRECVEAIEARDVVRAERTMAKHLELVRNDLLSATENIAPPGGGPR